MYRLLGLAALLIFPSWNLLRGQCLQGDCGNGYGTFVYPNGDKYLGYFKAGQPHGQGILEFGNGDKYLGSWENSFRQGQGKLIFFSGNEYIGGFLRNQFHGQGIFRYANGDRYEGEFFEGLFHGQGTLFRSDGSTLSGAWVRGMLPEAKGEADRNCNLEFCQTGKGQYTYGDGSRYKGEFLNGLPEGMGVMDYANGDRYVGNWKQHAPHGEGTMYLRSGETIAAVWEYGKPKAPVQAPPPAKTPATPAYDPEVRIFAVIVGVSFYHHMPVLRYSDDDAYKIYGFLKSPEGGALPAANIRMLIDEDATRANILGALTEIFSLADANDAILFYYSGHGLPGSFIPYDYNGHTNVVLHQEIVDLLRQSPAKHKIVLVDACFSGTVDRLKNVDGAAGKLYEAFDESAGGMALLLSSKPQEYSLEDGDLRSSVFSFYLMKGLEGEADSNGDKIITVEEAFAYVQTRVRAYTAQAQNPVMGGVFDGTMPLAIIR